MSDEATGCILVSACLAGFPCRYDGRAATDERVVELVRRGRAIPVCPEQLAGLPTPRPAVEVAADGRVRSKAGEDFTATFAHGAARTLCLAQSYGCRQAILKAKSPSCGFGEIYDGQFSGQTVEGVGVTAQLLIDNGIEVESD